MGDGISPSELRRVRRAVFVRDLFTCRDCGEWHPPQMGWNGEGVEGLTLGHIRPKSHGGTWRITNLVTQCRRDNEDLDDRLWVPNWRTVYHVPLTTEQEQR